MSALDAGIIEIECRIVKKFDCIYLFYAEHVRTLILSISTPSFLFGRLSPGEDGHFFDCFIKYTGGRRGRQVVLFES
jgi:hypothetical protein